MMNIVIVMLRIVLFIIKCKCVDFSSPSKSLIFVLMILNIVLLLNAKRDYSIITLYFFFLKFVALCCYLFLLFPIRCAIEPE